MFCIPSDADSMTYGRERGRLLGICRILSIDGLRRWKSETHVVESMANQDSSLVYPSAIQVVRLNSAYHLFYESCKRGRGK